MRSELGQIPVLSNLHFAVTEFHQVSRGQFANPLECRVGIGNVAEIEVLQQTFGIDLGQFWMQSEDRLDLGSKKEPAVVPGIMQRFLTQPVASQQQRILFRVVESNREHAAKLLDAVRSHLFVEMDDYLGIAVGVELMAPALEFAA